MPVNPDDIDLIALRQVEVYKEAEVQILGIIRDHLRQGIDRPTWADERLAAVGALRRAAQHVLATLQTDNGAGIRAAIAEAYSNGRGTVLSDLPGAIGAEARAAGKTVPRLDAIESLSAALIRDVGERRLNVLRNVEDVYRQTITAAVARSIAAGITRREASQAAWQGFVDRGVTSFTDRAGRTWRLTTYVEMAVRTVTMRAAIQGQLDRFETLGIDLVTISNEVQECKRCRPWEGKVLSISGPPGARVLFVPSITTAQGLGPTMTSVASTRSNEGELVRVEVAGSLEEARLLGLFHPNCRHTVRAFLPGATRLPTGPTEQPDENKARERQREIERKIRGNKEQALAALTPEAKKTAEAKVRTWQAEMRQHLKDNPKLKRLPYREEIGAGNLPPGGKAPSPAGRLTGPPPKPDAPASSDVEFTPRDLDTMKVQQLRALAKQRGTTIPAGAGRDDILTLLRATLPRRVAMAPQRTEMALDPASRLGRHLDDVNLIPHGMPDDLRQSIAAELAHQASLTPGAAMLLRGIEIPEPGTVEEADWLRTKPPGVGMRYSFEPAWIEVTPDFHRDPDLVRGTVTDAVERGWLAPGHETDAARLFLAHEYGHHVSRVIRWVTADHRWNADKIKRLVWPLADELNVPRPELVQNLLTTLSPLAAWLANPVVEDKVRQMVSGYGAAGGFEELLAEIWAEYSGLGEGARPLQQRIGAIMRAMVEEAATK